MRRAVVIVLVAIATGLGLVGAPASGAPPTSTTQARSAHWCHRTLSDYPILHPGDWRRAVRTLQCALRDTGYGPLVVDGWYGPSTRRAVRRVEAGFEGPAPQAGRINNGFWVLLYGRQLPDRDLRLGDSGRAVRNLQRALRAAGAEIVVDGDFGPQTRRVVRRYQGQQHFRRTGVVDERTRFILAMGGVFGHLN